MSFIKFLYSTFCIRNIWPYKSSVYAKVLLYIAGVLFSRFPVSFFSVTLICPTLYYTSRFNKHHWNLFSIMYIQVIYYPVTYHFHVISSRKYKTNRFYFSNTYDEWVGQFTTKGITFLWHFIIKLLELFMIYFGSPPYFLVTGIIEF